MSESAWIKKPRADSDSESDDDVEPEKNANFGLSQGYAAAPVKKTPPKLPPRVQKAPPPLPPKSGSPRSGPNLQSAASLAATAQPNTPPAFIAPKPPPLPPKMKDLVPLEVHQIPTPRNNLLGEIRAAGTDESGRSRYHRSSVENIAAWRAQPERELSGKGGAWASKQSGAMGARSVKASKAGDTPGALPAAEIEKARRVFATFDSDGSGYVDKAELSAVMAGMGEQVPASEIERMIAEVDKDGDKQVNFEELCMMLQHVKAGGSSQLDKVYQKQAKLLTFGGHTDGVMHAFSEEEKVAFVSYLNQNLMTDSHLSHLLPIDPDGLDLFASVYDGILFCKLINFVEPETIDERAMNKKVPLSTFQITENMNLAINASKSIGCRVVNIGWKDLHEGTPHLVLGLLWQIIKIGLLSKVNIKEFPELFKLLNPGEELADLLKLPPEKILLRWINYHLKEHGSSKVVKNFGKDLADAEAYTILLHRVAPKATPCDLTGLTLEDKTKRATKVLQDADRIGVTGFQITAQDITSGNDKLNLGFVAAIFNTYHGLDPVSEEELNLLDVPDDDSGDSREERAFRMYLNSKGIESYIHNLYDDLLEGIPILEAMDKVEPGIVDWGHVTRPCKTKFDKLANCNYAVELGLQMGFSLVAIGGTDIVDRNVKLILAIMWQLMRYDVLKFLASLKGESGSSITDKELIVWANTQVAAHGETTKISNFKDSALKDGKFLLHLVAAVAPSAVDQSLVKPGETAMQQEMNAKYAISCARKIGCVIFLLWEDIVEVKPKMIMTFVASVMGAAMQRGR